MGRNSRHLAGLRTAYEAVKAACAKDWSSSAAGDAIFRLADLSLRFLSTICVPIELVSKVPGKEYVGYANRGARGTVSRPANRALFLGDAERLSKLWGNWSAGTGQTNDWAMMSYTVALAPCLAMELFDRQNKKGPATYFECLIGHIFARTLRCNPRKQASFPVQGRSVRLTMDFLFDRPGGVGIHLPVKMSTRERVVQAWAHQRILDGAFGEGAYKGVMVLFSETKLDSRSHEVVEICVPDQWLIYQTLLAKMVRIYYFDVPPRYQALTAAHPSLIQIKQFGDFFTERAAILGA